MRLISSSGWIKNGWLGPFIPNVHGGCGVMLMNFASNLGSTVAAINGVRDSAAVCAGLGAGGPAGGLVELVDSTSNLLCIEIICSCPLFFCSVFSSEMSMSSSGYSSWCSSSGKSGTMGSLPSPLFLFGCLSSSSACGLFLPGLIGLSVHGLNGGPPA